MSIGHDGYATIPPCKKCNKLQDENKQLKENLAKYGNHIGKCRWIFGVLPCKCGFEQALKGEDREQMGIDMLKKHPLT